MINNHELKKQPLDQQLARIFRASSGRLLAVLTNESRDLQLAEDVLQEAFMQASKRWLEEIPNSPEAWLLTVARRRLIDHYRKHKHANNEPLSVTTEARLTNSELPKEATQPIPDERLKLIFTCCHPALNEQTQIALTLHTLCGLSAREIARAFLVSESTMAQRLVRAKRKISKAGIAYQVPEPAELPARLETVCAVIYLIYNESYSAFEGQTLTRKDLANEAIRLARILNKLLPNPEAAGLLALMLLHQARSTARSSDTQGYIPLEQQDRSRWDQQLISSARTILLAALAQGKPGKYQLQAAISALHCEASDWQATDWQQILLLYLTLYKFEPTPVVKLNAIIASSYVSGAKQAYEELLSLQNTLADYQPYYAARAEMESELRLFAAAQTSYRQAIRLSNNQVEKEFFKQRLKAIDR